MAVNPYPHLFVNPALSSSEFTSRQSGRDNITFPDRSNVGSHARHVRAGLNKAWKASKKRNQERASVSLPTRTGTYIEFQSAPGFELRTKSLDLRTSGIRLLNVVTTSNEQNQQITHATVFVPSGKEKILLKKIDQYEKEKTPSAQPKNEPLIASIDNLREAVLESFWRDEPPLQPKDSEWCEVWLRIGNDPTETISSFSAICKQLEIPQKEGFLTFPERSVVLICATTDQLKDLLYSSDDIAEFRKAKSTATFWTEMQSAEQAEWALNLASRTAVNDAPAVSACVIDTGVNNGHVLLQSILDDSDCHTVFSDWGVNDENGHGTRMCGIAAYGAELESLLQTDSAVEISYCLESVKLIPESGQHHEPALYGLRTKQAISRAEIQRRDIGRVSCLAVTSDDHNDEGRPTSWSGSIDQLCAGAEDASRRLILVAAGNVLSPEDWKGYPETNITKTIQDPAQAWNALTVGAVTHKSLISDDELAEQYSPMAKSGELSPFTSTSQIWDKKWPNKPDIVFEGGNLGMDKDRFTTELDDLSVLTTNHLPQTAQFTTMNMTSAATAQASHFAANLWAQYPDAWPETIRALIVHSADWNDALRSQFSSNSRSEKQNFEILMRLVGYGEPSAAKAATSASNSLTLIVEQEIQPFTRRATGNEYKTNEMHLIELPWPKQALNDLPGETEVRIDVTLSYFVEPGPGEIGWRDKYRYRSHGLDFDLIGPQQTTEEFLKSLNKNALEEGEEHSGGSAIAWTIGRNTRSRGSLHRDWWTTTAADAVQCNTIGIFPRSGWWKERHHLRKGESSTRYSLVVTIDTPPLDIDIYTPVASTIDLPTAISVK